MPVTSRLLRKPPAWWNCVPRLADEAVTEQVPAADVPAERWRCGSCYWLQARPEVTSCEFCGWTRARWREMP
jgi:hypothetical protein